jgi:hypothetical protein
LYVVGALAGLGSAANGIRLAVGNNFKGFDKLMETVLTPKFAWPTFAVIAFGVVCSTTASILSLWVGCH